MNKYQVLYTDTSRRKSTQTRTFRGHSSPALHFVGSFESKLGPMKPFCRPYDVNLTVCKFGPHHMGALVI